jgi:hypothetical protein
MHTFPRPVTLRLPASRRVFHRYAFQLLIYRCFIPKGYLPCGFQFFYYFVFALPLLILFPIHGTMKTDVVFKRLPEPFGAVPATEDSLWNL